MTFVPMVKSALLDMSFYLYWILSKFMFQWVFEVLILAVADWEFSADFLLFFWQLKD